MSFQNDRVTRLWNQLRSGRTPTCSSVKPLLSAYVDSMAVREGIESHLLSCPACRKEVESLRAMQGYLAAAPKPETPKHLAIDVRLKLSQARHVSRSEGLMGAILDRIQPMAIRAALGVSVSMVLFGLLSIALASQPVMANPGPDPGFRPAQPTEEAKLWLAGLDDQSLNGPMLIEAFIGPDGVVNGFQVLEGAQDPATMDIIWDRLYFAQFYPATKLGVPSSASVILSFAPDGMAMWAAAQSQAEMLQFLASHRADLDARSVTPIRLAQ